MFIEYEYRINLNNYINKIIKDCEDDKEINIIKNNLKLPITIFNIKLYNYNSVFGLNDMYDLFDKDITNNLYKLINNIIIKLNNKEDKISKLCIISCRLLDSLYGVGLYYYEPLIHLSRDEFIYFIDENDVLYKPIIEYILKIVCNKSLNEIIKYLNY